MSRGKHAAKAALRVAREADAEIAALRAELKEARRHLAAAQRESSTTKALRTEIERLRGQVAIGASDDLAAALEALGRQSSDHEKRLELVAIWIADYVARDGGATPDEWRRLRDLLGSNPFQYVWSKSAATMSDDVRSEFMADMEHDRIRTASRRSRRAPKQRFVESEVEADRVELRERFASKLGTRGAS